MDGTNIKPDVVVRWLIRRDMPEILRIENACFEFPWTEDEFIRLLRQRNCIGMVSEIDDKVVGYMLYELEKGLLHILTFAVDPAVHRKGVGSSMVGKLTSKLHPERRTKVTVMVRESNLAALRFFRASGFYATGLTSSPYEDSGDDGINMVFDI